MLLFFKDYNKDNNDNNKNDKSYSALEQDDITLGSEDTNINQQEINDIEQEASMTRTPTQTPKKSTGKSKTTDDLADQLSKTSLKDNSDGTNFSQSFAKLHFTFREGAKDVAIYEVILISDSSMLCHYLPGGQKLSILFGYPRELASERASRKILTLLGIQYDTTLARVTSRSSQVGHFINSKFEHTEEQLEGVPQIINLPFKCVEGSLPGGDVTWLKWHKKGRSVQYNGVLHQQFYDIMLVKVISQHSCAVELGEQANHVLDDSDFSGYGDEEDSMGAL